MVNKRGKGIFIIFAIVMILLSLSSFTACNRDKGPMEFYANTTAEEIVEMIESGKITSCTISVNPRTKNQYVFKLSPDFFHHKRIEFWDKGSRVFDDIIVKEECYYRIYGMREYERDGEGGLVQNDLSCSAHKPEADYVEGIIAEWWGALKDAILQADSMDISSYIANGDLIRIWNEAPAAGSMPRPWFKAEYIEICNVNYTYLNIPEEFENYRELAEQE